MYNRYESPTTLGIPERWERVLCYAFGWLSGLVLLIVEQRNHNVRRHAAQSVMVFGALSILAFVVATLGGHAGWLAGGHLGDWRCVCACVLAGRARHRSTHAGRMGRVDAAGLLPATLRPALWPHLQAIAGIDVIRGAPATSARRGSLCTPRPPDRRRATPQDTSNSPCEAAPATFSLEVAGAFGADARVTRILERCTPATSDGIQSDSKESAA